MLTAVPKTRDFSPPIEADFIVSLKAKNGQYSLFVEAFRKKGGKPVLLFTSDVREARRFSKLTAFDVCKEVEEYRCIGQVERVLPDGRDRKVVEA